MNSDRTQNADTAGMSRKKAAGVVTPLHRALLPAVREEGSFAGVARRLGVSRQALNWWMRSQKIPHRHLIEVHRRYHIPYSRLIEGATNNG